MLHHYQNPHSLKIVNLRGNQCLERAVLWKKSFASELRQAKNPIPATECSINLLHLQLIISSAGETVQLLLCELIPLTEINFSFFLN